MARLNYDGTLDATFDGDGKQTIDFGSFVDSLFAVEDECYGVAVQGDKIVLAGARRVPNDFAVARLNYDGTLDATFDGDGKQTFNFGGGGFGGYDFGFDVAVQGDKVVVAGYSFQGPTDFDFAVARLNYDGTLDATFDGDGKQTVDFGSYDNAYSVAVQGDKIVLVGFAYQVATGFDFAVARLDSDGTLDATFDSDGKQTVDFGSNDDESQDVAVQTDGRIVVVGISDQGAGYDFALARLNNDGELDSAFDGDGKQIIDFGPNDGDSASVAVQSDGNIVVAGYSHQGAATGFDFAVARFDGGSQSIAGTSGDDTIVVSQGTQAGTLKVTVNGNATDNIPVGPPIVISGGDGNDTFTVSAALDSGLNLDGQGGSDTYTIDLGALPGDVAITDSGVSGTDSLTVNGTTGDDIINVKGGVVTRGSPVAETVTYAGLENATINGGAGNDTITDPDSTNLTLLGGPGNDTITIQNTVGPVTADGGDGADVYVVNTGSLQAPVSLADTGTTGTDNVSIVGTSGTDTVTQSGNTVTANDSTIIIGPGLDSLTIDGGGGAGDSFTVTGTPSITPTVQGIADTVVTGTAGNDTILITPVGNTGQVKVKLNGNEVGTYRPTGRMIVNGLGGADDIQVAGRISVPMWLYGGAGNDRLKGGDSDDVLLGEDGDDLLVGGSGRDLLIGGNGADRIVGDADDDILIAGRTSLDDNKDSLAAVMNIWTSSPSFAARRSALTLDYLRADSGPSGPVTVFDDNAEDVLTGSSGQDWFFAQLDGDGVNRKKDKITDLGAAEFANDLDFIAGH